VILQVENYYSGEIRIKDGLPESSKADRDYHGFGIASIRSNVAKYGGTISIDTKDQVFSLLVLIPIP
ncbi:MAG: GHKL domain-containing protein, partial [Blautia sp.]|nr:GHKL domain-containing protein [Blautia sp.]